MTRKEVALNENWIIINNNVFNIEQFQWDHPGGRKALVQYGGIKEF